MQHMFHTEIIGKANHQQNKPHKFDKTNLHLAQMKKKLLNQHQRLNQQLTTNLSQQHEATVTVSQTKLPANITTEPTSKDSLRQPYKFANTTKEK